MNTIIIAKMGTFEYKYKKHRRAYKENVWIIFSHFICQAYQVNPQKFL